MAEHPNVERVRRGYQAFTTGDIASLSELIDQDAVWHNVGRNELSGDYKGQEEIFGMFGRLAQATEGTLDIEIHDILANDEHAVALITTRFSRQGRSYEAPEAHVFHVRDGKVTEFWGLSTDQYLEDEVMNA